MNRNLRSTGSRQRRGAILLLSAFFMIVMLGVIAFAVDLGYMLVVKTQLQVAADSAAMAAGANMAGTRTQVEDVAKQFAAYHKAGGNKISLAGTDVEYGIWDTSTRTFVPQPTVGNAIKVTAKLNNSTGGNGLFFARVFGKNTFDSEASAIALGNPRDICLVVDLSGSMNNDTEPGYSGTGVPSGTYGSIKQQMLEEVYSDFNFGSAYPGVQQAVGAPLGVSTYNNLIKKNGVLTKNTIPSEYRIKNNDSAATKKSKAYGWIIDVQLGGANGIMKNAKPTPTNANTTSFNYWSQYLDLCINNNYQLGYRTYLQFMMDKGREQTVTGSTYTPLSTNSPDCPWHTETVGGSSFSFPPREYPTHACRRALIAAIQEIAKKNTSIPDVNQRDWVSIVTFDTLAGSKVHYSLAGGGNYTAAMTACTNLQATSDVVSTATETGLLLAREHIKAKSQGGLGRENTQKVVVLLTDGMPNLKTSSDSAVSSYRSSNPSPNFYGGGAYSDDAALMQAHWMNGKHWKMFGVGIGLGTDFDFMDRLSRMGATANENGEGPRTSGDPAAYELELRNIFKQIVDTPQVRLVY